MTILLCSVMFTCMENKDARSLSPKGQEAIRTRAVKAVVAGMTHQEAADAFGVARGTITKWIKIFRSRGEKGLKAKPQGRPKESRLKGYQAATIVRIITDRCPDQIKLPFALWTRDAVAALIERRYGLKLSVWTVGRYLRRWGFTPQKPMRRAFEQDPAAVKDWLDTEYPGIRTLARKEKAEIHWGDEMGLRSDHQVGRTWSRKGQTPVVPGTGKRFRCNVLSTITNRGTLRFQVFHERFTASLFIGFLRRLLKSSQKKVFLIVDRHPVHRSRKVSEWLARHEKEIRLFFLPAYSPQLNPDEFLNNDVKANAAGCLRPRGRDEMIANVRTYLRSTQKQPVVVQKYFEAKPVRYASY